MTRRVSFWVGLVIVAVAALIFTFHFFPRAFPIVSIDLRMDRRAAMERAAEIARQDELGPSSFSQAASFGVDSPVQTYVELEAGGVDAFRKLMASGLYSPYTWQVRNFEQGVAKEVSFWFTPSGSPYGFRETLPEQEPGTNVPRDEALRIAEGAAPDWNVQLSDFKLIESQSETKSGGRVDHTFVYERPNEKIGEALFRLRIRVSGNRVSEVFNYIKIPEAFTRHYQEMRAANDTIAFGSLVAIGVLYFLGGCVIGLFFLLRQRWVIWRTAVIWAAVIAFLLFLAQINELPLLWMDYDTALPASGFLLNQILQALGSALAMGGVLAVTFMAAEGLTRRAFPQKIQFWRLWSPGVANSKAVLGRTLGGYLCVTIFFAYEVGLYIFSTKYLGWWTPSDALIQPDALATYFPWLNAIATSLQAGFWEECLFRAIPLAGAVLLGRRFGGNIKYWVGCALVLEAVIFGAGHANYPAQPAYARLVELIIPALAFGILYLLFGLLPGIILHFTFDVCWFALPIFVSTSPGVWIDEVLIVALTLIPLWVVLVTWLRRRRWAGVDTSATNGAWAPPLEIPEVGPEVTIPQARLRLASRTKWILLGLAVLGILLWIWQANLRNDAPPLDTTRVEAVSAAQQELAARKVQLGRDWTEMTAVREPLNDEDRFVWQEGGRKAYEQLLGTYLEPPYWEVRYARFSGNVAERAEEYIIQIGQQGKVLRFDHELPESRPGASLSEDQARALADSAIRSLYGVDPADLRRVGSAPSELPHRKDWVFTYADDQHYPLKTGEARIDVKVSGDQVTDAFRSVHVPEEWQRQERRSQNILRILSGVCGAFLGLIVFVGAIVAIVNWTRRRFAARSFVLGLIVLFALYAVLIANRWGSIEAGFSTAQPFSTQFFVTLVALILGSLISAAALGLLYGLSAFWMRETPSEAPTWYLGFLGGVFAAGLIVLAEAAEPSLSPNWGDYVLAGTAFPFLGVCTQAVSTLFSQSIFLLFAVLVINRVRIRGSRRGSLTALLIILLGFGLAGSSSIPTLPSWLILGVGFTLALGIVYWLLFRVSPASAVTAVAALAVLRGVRQAIQDAYPAALPASIVSIGLILVLVFLWQRSWRDHPQELWKRM
jgi:hypothetical protein